MFGLFVELGLLALLFRLPPWPDLLLLLKSSKVARGTERGSLPQTAYFLVPSYTAMFEH